MLLVIVYYGKYPCKRWFNEFSQKSQYDKSMKIIKICHNNKGKIKLVVENIINK